uniref:Uncharacterized protein n=1 Tax=Candidatus Kentrum sp. TUN TaxID=2126343 RepID=A0A450ZXC8_9GAMM|nr:MAG: hypothetical protein BECKTUN1418F_GA0071002_105214 [Candidatus Kentron sp. TUN]VFK58418.1 MAG: hypothetical protein BECKTUN1418E_GA0071001_104915 [Candidatus Kentron sp. TUN]VFK58524.1 MAG: hypothetical protein BECKTUN1418D_GA0071000_10849 [Candidatus Kentron sp. TUN]
MLYRFEAEASPVSHPMENLQIKSESSVSGDIVNYKESSMTLVENSFRFRSVAADLFGCRGKTVT